MQKSGVAQSQLIAAQLKERYRRTGTAPANEHSDTRRLNESHKVKNATESAWDSVKAGTRKTYDALKDGFQQSRQWASETIAP
jgi:hypothetical protein